MQCLPISSFRVLRPPPPPPLCKHRAIRAQRGASHLLIRLQEDIGDVSPEEFLEAVQSAMLTLDMSAAKALDFPSLRNVARCFDLFMVNRGADSKSALPEHVKLTDLPLILSALGQTPEHDLGASKLRRLVYIGFSRLIGVFHSTESVPVSLATSSAQGVMRRALNSWMHGMFLAVTSFRERFLARNQKDWLSLTDFVQFIYEQLYIMDTQEYLEEVFGVFDRDHGAPRQPVYERGSI
eukprot:SAG11_NODE_136_length_15118_cov_14.188495_11_plen_238_part_00